MKRLTHCMECHKELTKATQTKFCSIACSNTFRMGKSTYVRANWNDDFMKSLMMDYLSTPAPAAVCSVFGCKRHLSINEQLFGDRCIDHQDRNLQDITKHINI